MSTPIYRFWSLLCGLLFISLCGGMQTTLLGVRADAAGFDVQIIGAIMAAYFLGFIIGAKLAPAWIRSVGHIRVFAALASVGSTSILMHAVFVNEPVWFLLRTLTGVCFAGMFLVSESWLNAISDNKNRGTLISLYVFTVSIGYVISQALIGLASPEGYELFILSSVLISLALVPLLMTPSEVPVTKSSKKIKFRVLFSSAPLGVTGVFVHGVNAGAVMSLTAIFARSMGFSYSESALMVAALMTGGVLFQLPVGKLSDIQDRRHTLFLLTFLALLACIVIILFAGQVGSWTMAAMLLVAGGVINTTYSIAASHVNDQISAEQTLSVSSGLIMINGLGGVLGPIIGAQVMRFFDAQGLYIFVAVVCAMYALFALYRINVKPAMVVEEQSAALQVTVPTSAYITAEAMDEADP
ncbi:MFS transporter [Porticoccus sp. W117]|uniref:MFS transporter n=1 Tax=Porticoccus sp. W117 TaxID=3054777 RepID=UPI002594C89E|nr:MFS transporter [Porticoccus sp. W117]MDM3871388.1 MFS transporter [Porticoccus sp. W117]